MAIRRKRQAPRISPTVRKQLYHLVGGPLDGVGVWLSGPSTLPISCKGQRGVYQTDPTMSAFALRWFVAAGV